MPRRMAFFYVPNGVHLPDWMPKETGSTFALPATLQPLAPFKDDLLVLTGLAQHNAEALGDGPGDHARSLASFLTGTHALKTDGAGIRVGVSVDQVAAQKIGRQTRLPSLELGIERGAQSGNCDSGYSCAYSSNISWRSANMPMAKEVNPKLVFDRLFAVGRTQRSPAERRKRELYQKSILDLVLDDAAAASQSAGLNDRRKIDEYLTAVREVEAAHRSNRERGQEPAGDRRDPSAGSSRRHRRTHPAHVRPDRPGVPVRRHAHLHVHVRQRGEQPQLSVDQRARRPPRPLAPRRRPQEAREAQDHQSLPHRTIRLSAGQAQVDPGGLGHRSWITR